MQKQSEEQASTEKINQIKDQNYRLHFWNDPNEFICLLLAAAVPDSKIL